MHLTLRHTKIEHTRSLNARLAHLMYHDWTTTTNVTKMIYYVAEYIGGDMNAFDVHTRHGRMYMALSCNLKLYAI